MFKGVFFPSETKFTFYVQSLIQGTIAYNRLYFVLHFSQITHVETFIMTDVMILVVVDRSCGYMKLFSLCFSLFLLF